jgi:hypothetical protein
MKILCEHWTQLTSLTLELNSFTAAMFESLHGCIHLEWLDIFLHLTEKKVINLMKKSTSRYTLTFYSSQCMSLQLKQKQ